MASSRPTGPSSGSTAPTPVNAKYHGPLRRAAAPAPGASAWREWLDDGVDVFAYFNNDWDGHAVLDATWLRDRLEDG